MPHPNPKLAAQAKSASAPSQNEVLSAVGAKTSETDHILNSFIGPVLVASPILVPFKGAVSLQSARNVWTWLSRDVDPDIPKLARHVIEKRHDKKLTAGFATRISAQIAEERTRVSGYEGMTKRLSVQLGGEDVFNDLESIQKAFRFQALLEKAVAFGQAVDKVKDENALGTALNSLPVKDPTVSALLMHASINKISDPHRLVSVIADLAGSNTQAAVAQTGLAPFIDAIIAHAQNQLGIFSADVSSIETDLARQKLDRFHRLIRAASIVIDDEGGKSGWSAQVATLIRRMSDLVEPLILKVDVDIRLSLRKPRLGADALDTSQVQKAQNGIHLLTAARAAKDTLALNAVIETAWAETGRALEILTARNLEAFRASPHDNIIARRLDASIQMSIIRFNPEFGEVLNRAKSGAEKIAQAEPATASVATSA